MHKNLELNRNMKNIDFGEQNSIGLPQNKPSMTAFVEKCHLVNTKLKYNLRDLLDKLGINNSSLRNNYSSKQKLGEQKQLRFHEKHN